MGCGASTVIVPPRQLVLLGGGECGKTTIFKQMQILYGVGFEAVAMEWIDACHRSPMRTVKSLLMALQNKVDTYTLLESNQVRTHAGLTPCPTPLLSEAACVSGVSGSWRPVRGMGRSRVERLGPSRVAKPRRCLAGFLARSHSRMSDVR